MICVDGEAEPAAARTVIDLAAQQEEQQQHAAAPATPAQQHMHTDGIPTRPMQVDIGHPPATPRAKREAAGGGNHSPTKQSKAGATSQSRRMVSSCRCSSSS